MSVFLPPHECVSPPFRDNAASSWVHTSLFPPLLWRRGRRRLQEPDAPVRQHKVPLFPVLKQDPILAAPRLVPECSGVRVHLVMYLQLAPARWDAGFVIPKIID